MKKRIMDELNERGEIFLTHTRLNGRFGRPPPPAEFEHLSYELIASIMGRPVGTLRSRMTGGERGH